LQHGRPVVGAGRAAEPAPFVGRERELEVLRQVFDEAADASPRFVLVEGPPGIGKTALLRRFCSLAAGSTVLWADGDEGERTIPYAVLHQLTASARVPPLASPVDPLAAGAALLSFVGHIQERGPAVIVIDDGHWADLPSLSALGFALRRLRVDRVLALVAVRDEEVVRVPPGLVRLAEGERGRRLRLAGLAPQEIGDLSHALGSGRLDRNAADRLHSHTGGNPLYVRALIEELGVEALAQAAEALPAPRQFAAMVADRLGRCRPAARALVEAGAVLGRRWRQGRAAEIAGLEDTTPAIDEAVSAGLLTTRVESRSRSVEFTHPLIWSAVYHQLAPGRRSELHRRAAAIAVDQGEIMRHRAAATLAPDALLAAELASFGNDRAREGAWAAAGEALLSAVRLSPDGPDRERYQIEAFEYLLANGDHLRAAALAGEAETFTDPARRAYLLGMAAIGQGLTAEAGRLFEAAWAQCDRTRAPGLAASIASWLASRDINEGRGRQAAAWARQALDLDPHVTARATVVRVTLLQALGISGRFAEALELVHDLPDPLPCPAPEQVDQLLGRGVIRLWTEDLDRARADLLAVVRTCRTKGPFYAVVLGLIYLSEACWRLGLVDDASLFAELGVVTAEDAEWSAALAFEHAQAAFPLALRGDLERASAHARAAYQAAAAIGDTARLLWAAVAEARVAEAAGDPHAQAAALERFPKLDVDGLDEPGIQPWRELYVDALVRTGRLHEAELALGSLETRAAERGLASALAGATRLRGQLEVARGHREEALSWLERAVEEASRSPAPLPLARAQLALGGLLRRMGQPKAAAAQLSRARSILGHLGAQPLLVRCERELRATGQAVVQVVGASPSTLTASLTPQERAVAHLVVRGLSNKEVAAELVLSPKTVEYHLSHVFAKLGVRSRTELAARIGAAPLPSQP
jgi:ATP/maltotriose-dependent transcriptional regulator MalT